MSIIFSIATDIYKIYANEQEKTYNPQHLSQPILILFQRFKKAYESKNIEDLGDSISSDFCGDIYGTNKEEFINFMQYNLQRLKYGLSPHLTIEIFNISSASKLNFSGIVNMKANLKFVGVPTSIEWDAGKVICEAKPEGKYNYWRITKIAKFN